MDTDERELELGLGLSLGCRRMILTAGDLPNGSLSSRTGTAVDAAASVSGTKKTFTLTDPATTAVSQVVGWPPVGAYRMNSLSSLTKPAEEDMAVKEDKGEELAKKLNDPSNGNEAARKEIKTLIGFVKVNMDGLPIGRKVDLNAHVCYETLAQAIEDMFSQSATICGKKEQATMNSKLLDGSSEFVLTYEDKEGDWMLVGDVPWGMFLSTVKRLRIMRTSEANGLAPRFQERNARQRIEPI